MNKETSCTVEDCENPFLAKGLCSKHYQRWKKYGDANVVGSRRMYTSCTVGGCATQGKFAKGYCLKHYQRFKKYGSAEVVRKHGPKSDMPDTERFGEKVDYSPSCWLWKGYCNKGGYGSFSVKGSMGLAHRYSFEVFVEPVPENMYLDHKYSSFGCPRHCVNPEHLRLVTKQQNSENHKGTARGKSKSGIRNVHWDAQSGKWKVQVVHKGRSYHGGLFTDLLEAEKSAIALRLKLFTHNDVDRL